MGSGRSELARILFGLDPGAAGEIRLMGQRLNGLPPRERIQRGLAFLTEDRRAEGLCMEAAIADNVALVAWPRFARTLLRLVSRTESRAAVTRIRADVKLTASARDEQAVKTLSGGNQQKVVLAKWLLNEPRVFLLDEPTRGIDIGAKQEVYRLINDLAARGAGVLMISSEVEELIGMCDRILVLRRGEIRDTVSPPEFDRERILRAALHDEAVF
jgi:ribose transport system ATP-binding protein